MLKDSKGNRLRNAFDFAHEHIVVIIIAVVVLAGIISTILIIRGDAAPESSDEEVIEYREMNTVYFAMDEIETLDPLSSQDSDVYYISKLIYSSLFDLDENLSLKKDVVSSFETSKGNGSVKIKLRDDVRFSDGSRLTAEDVRFTVNQILRLGEDSPYYEYVSRIASVQVKGTYSLVITFEDPSDAALDNLIFPIVSSDSYETGSNRNPGSGPYRYSSFDTLKALKLKPNGYYFGGEPSNRVTFKIVKDKSKVTGLMTTDAVTAFVSTSTDADVDAEDKNLKAERITSSEMEYLAFNFDNKILSDERIRRAVAMSIDVQTIIDDNYGGSAVASDTVYFPGFLGTENQGDAWPLDQKGASRLLSECGYRDSDEDGYLENEKGKTLSLTILVNRGNSRRVDTAYSIAESLKLTGIKADVRALSWSEYRAAIKEGDFDIFLGGYKFDKKYNLKELFRKSSCTGYYDKETWELVSSLETCLGPKKQKEIYEKLKTRLIEDLPYYCLCYKTYTFVTVQHFESETLPTFFDIFRGCSTYKWQKTVVTPPENAEAEKK
ncbi:MAG: ABC transporter substrate-binding protein [Emergencia sp.]